ncbi:MAG TPA: SAVED domain-containing protein [Candidatus Limnocylindrales bacterium]
MTGAIRARQLGDEYQHRYFWIEACRLYTGPRNVARVGIEVPLLRAFDDVVTTYRAPILDAHGRATVVADHHQLKFHLRRRRRITGADLIDPAFINAERVSLLERAHEAVAGPNGDGRRLVLVTPWDVAENDPLADLVERDGAIDLDELFKGGPRARMTKLREAWRARLGGVDNTVLREVASRLQFRPNYQSTMLDRLLDNGLAGAGLAPIDYGLRIHPYLALSQRFITDDMREHDATGLDAIFMAEGLRATATTAHAVDGEAIGIKSFERFAYPLEDEADVLNLVPDFHGRYKRAQLDWDRDIAPKVGNFLVAKVRSGHRYDLYLDCLLTIAYLAGYELGKVDADVAPVDRRTRTAWRSSGQPLTGEQFDVREVRVGDGPALALAIEATRPIEDDVRLYATENEPSIGRILVLTPKGGAGQASVRDADHAIALAADTTLLLERHRTVDERRQPLHVFMAVPVQLAVLLGSEGRAYGPTVTYEYDFATRAPGAYSPSFHLPPAEQE